MGSKADADPRSTPKLSLYSLPTKPTEPAGMLTPPLRPPASVPFLWEEVPGKPRTSGSETKRASARSLELPPRLLSEIKITNLPSPTTVLDGPYVARSASCSSFKTSTISPEREKWFLGFAGGVPQRKEKEGLVGFWRKKGRRGNGRLDGSFSCAATVSGGDDGDGGVGFDSSRSSGSDVGSRSRRGGCGDGESEVKITRFRRNGSLLNESSASTHFWATVYGRLRHVVPWKVKKLNKDGPV